MYWLGYNSFLDDTSWTDGATFSWSNWDHSYTPSDSETCTVLIIEGGASTWRSLNCDAVGVKPICQTTKGTINCLK